MKLLKTIGALALGGLVLTGCPKDAKTGAKTKTAAKTMAKTADKTAAKTGAASKPAK